ncbi:MAG: hemolysin family protein [Phycisphaeraceae bacterium JB051]
MFDPFLIAAFILIPLLLCASGFFSGCETALFSLSESQRLEIQKNKNASIINSSLFALLVETRALLITLLLGNMVINVAYFIISEVAISILFKKYEVHGALSALVLIVPLLALILAGEVIPKMVAARLGITWARFFAVPLLFVHRALTVVRVLVSTLVVTPLARLIAPRHKPTSLSPEELESLLELSKSHGHIDADEESLLQAILELGQLKVYDVMTPRVDVAMFDILDDPSDLVDRMRREKRHYALIYEKDTEHLLGIVLGRQMMIDPPQTTDQLRRYIRQILYVPEMQRLDQLLTQFRQSGASLAVAVDEYGGTAGVIRIEDIVEKMVGPIVDLDDAQEGPQVMSVGLGVFRVSASLPIHEWEAFFGHHDQEHAISTIGGLVMAKLARLPKVGDTVQLGNLIITVAEMAGRRLDWLELKLATPSASGGRG